MNFIIETPGNFTKERMYIIDLLLSEFLGINFKIIKKNINNICIKSDDSKYLIIDDSFFSVNQSDWLSDNSMPKTPLVDWIVPNKLISKIGNVNIPVIYGLNPNKKSFFFISEKNINLGLDIFGSCFFMLTRYEELIMKEKDTLNRFQAKDSIAFREDFLDRPIVNEYLEILWFCIKSLWPNAQRKKKIFKTILSHDVDNPFEYALSSFYKMSRTVIGDVIKRGDFYSAITRPAKWYKVNYNNIKYDPKNTFDFIMDTAEKNNLTTTFNFISDHSNKQRDGNYYLSDKIIISLIKRINDRGHLIGMHGSFDSYNNFSQLKKEFMLLQNTCNKIGIKQNIWGSRQHYLRFDYTTTLQYLNDVGLHYDESLTYAERSGFRCGVCYDFQPFNILTRKKLSIKVRPLIVMECSVLDEDYMNLSADNDDAFKKIIELKNKCRKFNGNFTLLWHNDRLLDPKEKQLFIKTINS